MAAKLNKGFTLARIIFLAVSFSTVSCNQQSLEAYPATVTPTVGSPWPLPQSHLVSSTLYTLDAEIFQFLAVHFDCDILETAFARYRFLTFPSLKNGGDHVRDTRINTKSVFEDFVLKSLSVNIKTTCDGNIYPSIDSDESYTLQIDSDGARLNANTIWGGLRGLETFSQIVWQDDYQVYHVNKTEIKDFPRFQHRGTLLDTARHFLTVQKIKEHLDLLSQSKMNVFHWHIVDDQSFPFVSNAFPDLSLKGAWSPTHIYTPSDVQDIIEYARLRGIRVIPEFDSPGHSLSWGKSQKNLLTACYKGLRPDGIFGPINPSRNTSYEFLFKFFSEISSVFPDNYLHMGGDEVPFGCWESNPEIKQFMKDKGFVHYNRLEGYYMQTLLEIIGSLKKNYIIWQEVVDNGVKLLPETVVEVWKGGYEAELAKVTSMGYKTLLSSCWYLNGITSGADWRHFYLCDPHHFNGTDRQKKLVVGGEACMWGEFVDSTNLIPRFWPRASIVGERLWSSQNVTDLDMASRRIEEHRCRLLRRGHQVEPMNGPNFCKYE